MSSPHVHYTISGDETQARRLAGRAARRAEDAVAPYTTPGVEAAVVRLLGVAQVDPAGVPLARRFVEWLHDRGLLGTGGAHWLAGATIRQRAGARSQNPVADGVAWVLDQDPAPSEIAIPVEAAPEVLKHAVRGARRTLAAQWRARDDRLSTLAPGPEQQVVEIAPGDSTSLLDTANEGADLVLLAFPVDALPTIAALRRARGVADRAGERAGRYVRLGARGSGHGQATLAALVALAGLDALAIADLDGAEAFFARRVCAQAGVTFLGLGRAGDDLAMDVAWALVVEQLAALAGLPPAFWGWVPAQPAYREAMATLFADAFIARSHETDAKQDTFRPDTASRMLRHLGDWPAPALDPATLVEKTTGYWNPFA